MTIASSTTTGYGFSDPIPKMAAFRWLITGTPFGNHGRCLVSKDLAPARDLTLDTVSQLVSGSDFLVSSDKSDFLEFDTWTSDRVAARWGSFLIQAHPPRAVSQIRVA
jgi:hypothetical protein